MNVILWDKLYCTYFSKCPIFNQPNFTEGTCS